MKRVLIIVGVVVLVVGIVAVACAMAGFYYYRSSTAEASENGRRFGATTDQTGCLKESLRQVRDFRNRPNTYRERFKNQMIGPFTSGCLTVSKASKGFCDDVPRIEDLHDLGPSLEWQSLQCRDEPENSGCHRVFAAVIKECGKIKLETVDYPK